MAQEARSHLYIKPNDDDRSVQQNAAADVLPAEIAESQRQQTDDRDRNEVVEVIRPQLTERARQSPSHTNKNYKSRKHLDRSGAGQVHHQPDAATADKQEAKQMSREKLSTAVSVQKQSNDDHVSQLKKLDDDERTQATGRTETGGILAVSGREKHHKSMTTNDLRKFVTEKPTADDSETNVRKSHRRKHETKVQSHCSSEPYAADVKLADRKVRSLVFQPPDNTKTELAGRNFAGDDSSHQKSSGARNNDEVIRRRILNSFDKVCQIFFSSLGKLSDLACLLYIFNARFSNTCFSESN